ncbi:MAG TPA: Do family serine endopeptidase [Xanthobacteraceae bacterium]|nr:Do family serine endopeptidase [Xanthobacteraceae bacterium]
MTASMNTSGPDAKPVKGTRLLSARRFALLATTVFGLGAAAMVIAPAVSPPNTYTAIAQNVTQKAQNVARPTGFADIVDQVKPAVISVRVRGSAEESGMGRGDLPFPPGSPMERFFRQFGMPDGMGPQQGPRGRRGPQRISGQGSGFFISADGYAVTNNHVVEKADEVEIQTDDGKTYPAKVIGTDPRTDVALIKVEGRSDFPFAKLGEAVPRIGDWVLAVGNPFGLGGTVTAGIVSARGRDIGAGPYDDFIQIDAPVNKGNSGGPTFDVDGNVIGVNTAIYSPSGGSVGIAFAIPASTVKSVVDQLQAKGSVTRGWIGVQIQPVTQDIADSLGLKSAQGALVADPQANGPAAKAGVQAGDVITALNGNPVKDARDLARQVGMLAPNATTKLTLWSKGAEKTVDLTIGEMPNQQTARADSEDRDTSGGSIGRLGLTLTPAGRGEQGAVVTEVDPSGAAADKLRVGDVIVEANGRTVNSPADVRAAMQAARKDGRKSVLVRVKSDGDATRFVALPVGRG